jgi:hypothetical protein
MFALCAETQDRLISAIGKEPAPYLFLVEL